jgi:glyoxylase-like metal-dependent hydrolase (beta-lactamase superfamily II)
VVKTDQWSPAVKIFNVTTNSKIYTSNAYLVLGEWNTLQDINALIDTGSDPSVIKWIYDVYTGVGKKPVDRVILTHNHGDHNGALDVVIEHYKPEVFAFAPGPGVDHVLTDGEKLRIGDDYFEVIHVPQHSSDSICLFCRSERILFAGDTHLIITGNDTASSEPAIEILKRLAALPIESIYFGHGEPMLEGGSQAIGESLRNIRRNRSRPCT